MSYMMLHGLGDCTPGHNCGCIPKQPPAASVLYEHTNGNDYVLTVGPLIAARPDYALTVGVQVSADGPALVHVLKPADVAELHEALGVWLDGTVGL